MKLTNEQKKLADQFKRLIQSPVPSRLTKDLYEFLYTSCGFIAHTNKDGFYNSRFVGLSNFDLTMEIIRTNKSAKFLYDSVTADEIAWAAYKIAVREASVIHQQIKVNKEYLENMQSRFNLKLIDEAY